MKTQTFAQWIESVLRLRQASAIRSNLTDQQTSEARAFWLAGRSKQDWLTHEQG